MNGFPAFKTKISGSQTCYPRLTPQSIKKALLNDGKRTRLPIAFKADFRRVLLTLFYKMGHRNVHDFIDPHLGI